MTVPVNRTAPRPVGQPQQSSSVTGKANQRVAHAASSVRRSSLFKQFMGSARLLMTRGLNFVSPGNVRAGSKRFVSECMTHREVGKLLRALSNQSADRRDVERVLVDLESTMRPNTSESQKYNDVLAGAVRTMAKRMESHQLDNILTRLGEMNAPPNQSARISLVRSEVVKVRPSVLDRPTI